MSKRSRSRGDRERPSRRRRPRGADDYDEDRWDDDAYKDEEPPRRSRSRRSPGRGGGRGGSQKQSLFGRLFGSGRGSRRGVPPRSKQRFDWGEDEDERPVEDEGFDAGAHGADGYEDQAPRRGSRRRSRGGSARRKQTLMDLCTPVFGYATLLPQEPSEAQPTYKQFRDEAVAALRRIQEGATEHGIEAEDARLAAYALSLFLDEQVVGSEWTGKNEWVAEPLGIVLQQDPEGGVNFFRRLEELGDRQKAVRAVFLVCLALGFRGKYAELDATQQAAQIGEIRQKLVRSIHQKPLDQQDELFPDGYLEADPITDEVPPPPRWWMFASLGVVLIAVVLYFVLFWAAGRAPESADETIRPLISSITEDHGVPVAVAAAGVRAGGFEEATR